MKIRMDVSDELYLKYKKIAEQNGFAVTKLNQIVFEQAVNKWIIENKLKNAETILIISDLSGNAIRKINIGNIIIYYLNVDNENIVVYGSDNRIQYADLEKITIDKKNRIVDKEQTDKLKQNIQNYTFEFPYSTGEETVYFTDKISYEKDGIEKAIDLNQNVRIYDIFINYFGKIVLIGESMEMNLNNDTRIKELYLENEDIIIKKEISFVENKVFMNNPKSWSIEMKNDTLSMLKK